MAKRNKKMFLLSSTSFHLLVLLLSGFLLAFIPSERQERKRERHIHAETQKEIQHGREVEKIARKDFIIQARVLRQR